MLPQTAWMVLWKVAAMIALESKCISRRVFDVDKNMAELQEDSKWLYRVLKEQFKILVDLVSPKLKRQRRIRTDYLQAIYTEVSLFITLRMLSGESYLDVSWPHFVGNSTVYLIFNEGICV